MSVEETNQSVRAAIAQQYQALAPLFGKVRRNVKGTNVRKSPKINDRQLAAMLKHLELKEEHILAPGGVPAAVGNNLYVSVIEVPFHYAGLWLGKFFPFNRLHGEGHGMGIGEDIFGGLWDPDNADGLAVARVGQKPEFRNGWHRLYGHWNQGLRDGGASHIRAMMVFNVRPLSQGAAAMDQTRRRNTTVVQGTDVKLTSRQVEALKRAILGSSKERKTNVTLSQVHNIAKMNERATKWLVSAWDGRKSGKLSHPAIQACFYRAHLIATKKRSGSAARVDRLNECLQILFEGGGEAKGKDAGIHQIRQMYLEWNKPKSWNRAPGWKYFLHTAPCLAAALAGEGESWDYKRPGKKQEALLYIPQFDDPVHHEDRAEVTATGNDEDED